MEIVGRTGVRGALVLLVALPLAFAIGAAGLLAADAHGRATEAQRTVERVEAFGAVASLKVEALEEIALLEAWSTIAPLRTAETDPLMDAFIAARQIDPATWAVIDQLADSIEPSTRRSLDDFGEELERVRALHLDDDHLAVAARISRVGSLLDAATESAQRSALTEADSTAWPTLVALSDLTEGLTIESLIALQIRGGDADESTRDELRLAVQRTDLALASLRRAIPTTLRAELDRIVDGPLAADVAALRASLFSDDASDTRTIADKMGDLQANADYIAAFDDLTAATIDDAATVARSATSAAERERNALLIGAAALLLVVLAVTVLIGRSLSGRIGRVAAMAHRISAGDLHPEPLELPGRDSVASLSRAMDDMVGTLRGVHGQIGALADGRPDAPELHTHLPGPIGETLRTAIDRLHRTTAELHRRSTHDELTGLLDLAGLRTTIGLLDRDRTQTIAVLMVDLDRFKAVNDQHGHDAGDHVLQVVADRLGAAARDGDLICRRGGDEFVLLALDVSSEDDVVALEQRISRAVTRPIDLGTEHVAVGASVGWEIAGPDDRLDDALVAADEAMYRAKRANRDAHRAGGAGRTQPSGAGTAPIR